MRNAGFFNGIRHHDPFIDDERSLDRCRGQLAPLSAKATVVAYLRSGAVFIGSPGTGTDYFGSGDPTSLAIMTDGEWIWPADYAYYVDKHDVWVPADLVARAIDAVGAPARVSRERLLELESEVYG